MVSRVAACPLEGEPNQPDSIHESVRRLLRWRYLLVAGVSVAAWVAIGSTSALAADRGHVHQSNTNTSTTAVDNNDGQSTGLVSGPIVTPVTVGVQTNLTGPVNVNALGNQSDSGNGPASVDQSNSNASTTVVDNHNAQSAGVLAGPVVAPVTVAVQTNANGPVNVNAGSNQANSGNGAADGVSQSNVNSSDTFVDNSGAQSTGVVSGPIVVPITLGVQNNIEGPLNGNLASNQADSGNGADGELRQTNVNHATTVLDNSGAQSTGVVSGPIVVPVTGQLGTNVSGPANVNALSNQSDSGNASGGATNGADPLGGQLPQVPNAPQQANVNESTTLVDNRRAQSTALGGVAGPIVAPVTPQVGTNVAGPVNVNAGGSQANSGNGAVGDVRQGNFNGSFTALDNRDAQSTAAGVVAVAGPVVLPVSPQVGTNVNGPFNVNALSNQRDSGNGNTGGLEQVNGNSSFTWLDNAGAQSTAGAIGGVAVAGPVVAPVSPQVGTNGSAPLDVNAASNQAASGNAGDGDVRQGNFNDSFTWVDNHEAQSQAAAAGLVGVGVAGPVVVPVSPQVGTNANGPGTVQVFSNQRDSGNGYGGDVEQLNANSSATFLDNSQAQSTSFGGGVVGVAVSGPVVVPVAPQVGTNGNGPLDVQGVSNQDLSGNGNGGNVWQGNFNDQLTWVDNRDAQSTSAAVGVVGAGGVAVSGPVVVPVAPQVGTNGNGPADANVIANQRDSGNADGGSVWQINGNASHTFLENDGAQSDSFAGSVGAIAGAGAVSGPIVTPISPQVGTNFNGPLNVNAAGNQQDSGDGNWGTLAEGNFNDSATWVSNRDAQSTATALAGGVGLAGAGALAVSGPIVVPVSTQVGTNYNGPINGNLLSSQQDSGNGNNGGATEVNVNRSATWLDNEGAQSNASAFAGAVGAFGGADAVAVSGPIVAPVAGQVGTNLNGPLNVNAGSNQFDSGNGSDGDVHQLNWQSVWTGVDNRDAQSNSVAGALGYGVIAGGEAGAVAVSGPIVAPVAPQVGTNGVGPANANLLSNQNDSGNAVAGTVDQLNGNEAFTWLDNEGAQSNAFAASGDLTTLTVAGSLAAAASGPVVAPITPQVGTNLNGPINVNGFTNQLQSGNGSDIRQLNWNSSWTGVDNRGAQSSAFAATVLLAEDEGGSGSVALAGPFVLPVSPQVGTNVTGPLNANVVSNAQDSENAGSGPVEQLNGNRSFTWLDNEGAQSNSFAFAFAGSLCDSGAGSVAVSGPVVTPIAPQVGTNAAGPVNVDAGSSKQDSGNAAEFGDVRQLNWQSGWLGVDNRDAQSNANSFAVAAGHDAGAGAVAISGPILVPVMTQVGTNLNGPVNANVVSGQDDSGNGNDGDAWQANVARTFTGLNNEAAQSNATAGAGALIVAGAGAAAVSGPIVVPVDGQVGTNVNGPANVNVASGQADSGNGNLGDVRQLNWNDSWTWVDNMAAQSDANSLAVALGAGAGSVSGPIVVPVNPQVGTNVNGPLNANVFSDQQQSGNGNLGDVWQVNANQTWTYLNNMNAQSVANAFSEVGVAVAGPIAAPLSPQVGTNVNGPVDVNAASNQADSGNGNLGDLHQLNWNWSWTWLLNDGAQSEATALIVPVAAAGPILAPVSPQVGTNVNGPTDVNLISNQDSSGNGNAGDIWQDNANHLFTDLTNTGSNSFSDGITGPAVVPIKVDGDTNGDGPVAVNGAGNQQDSGNPGGAMNLDDMANAGALRDASGPNGLAGLVVAALAGLTALASLVIARRRSVR
jgi:hypothetical protein